KRHRARWSALPRALSASAWRTLAGLRADHLSWRILHPGHRHHRTAAQARRSVAPGRDVVSRHWVGLVVIARDEESMLGDCLISAKPVVDAMRVCIDDRTTDATEHVARMHGARVTSFRYEEDLAAARNTAQ